jgi:hypothetical protein
MSIVESKAKIVLLVFLFYWYSPQAVTKTPEETPVEYFDLAAPLSARDAEISGMTWCGDQLLLLPQFPDFVARRALEGPKKNEAVIGKSFIYYFNKTAIDDYLSGKRTTPLKAETLILNENNIRKAMPNFDGFEAIVCEGDSLWLAMETSNAENKFGTHIVSAKLQGKIRVEISTLSLTHIPSISRRHNASNETLSKFGNQLLSIHEVNRANDDNQSKAHLFDPTTKQLSTLAFPALAHRITDATNIDASGKFWVINYGFANDPHLANTDDQLLAQYGVGASHQLEGNVERLLELEITGQEVRLTQRAPIPLRLTKENGRNWEGIARYEDKGLLIFTDKHPQSYFGFVPIEDLASVGD